MSNLKHGCRYTRLYDIWRGMRCRCKTKTSTSYKNYGARGITITKEWDSFINFKKWALDNGYNDTLTLDRINVYGNYEPNNCRWVTYKKQNINKRNNRYIEYQGQVKTLSEWAEEYNIKIGTLWARLNRGIDIERALTM